MTKCRVYKRKGKWRSSCTRCVVQGDFKRWKDAYFNAYNHTFNCRHIY